VSNFEDIKKLRAETGAGIMDCKEALNNSNRDFKDAIVWLRKKGLADIKNRVNKVASEGVVGHYIHAGSKIGVLVEVNCETDFVARSDEFKQFAKDLSMQIAAANPKWIDSSGVPPNIINKEWEIAVANTSGKPNNIVNQIAQGRLKRFFKETCLLDQPFVKDQNLTINDLLGDLISKVGEKVVIKRFVRFVVGE
jgi:elongation factor Ts